MSGRIEKRGHGEEQEMSKRVASETGAVPCKDCEEDCKAI